MALSPEPQEFKELLKINQIATKELTKEYEGN